VQLVTILKTGILWSEYKQMLAPIIQDNYSCTRRARSGVVFPRIISALAASLLVVIAVSAQAQQLEPRAYSNAPIGVNFISLGYAWSNGNVLLDPALPIENLDADIHVGMFQLSHSFSIAGDNAKFKFAIPWTASDWSGSIDNTPSSQKDSGIGDAWVGLDWLFHGAPALTLGEFSQYEAGVVLGAGLRLSIPVGDYNSRELLNLGSNRWSLRGELSASRAWDEWT
jgi:hypothetical protein